MTTVSKASAVVVDDESQRGLDALLHDLPGMAYRWRGDQERTALFVSAGCRDLTGYSSAQFFGNEALSFSGIIHPDDRVDAQESLQTALAARRPFELRYRIRTADGWEKWVSDRGRGVFAADGTLAMIEGCVTDITSHKRAEAALRESEEKFAKAFHASPGAMAISEPGGRGFIEVNDGYVRMFGYTREELIGRTMGELKLWGTEEERGRFMAAFATTGSVKNMEVVRRRRDGTLITCLLSAEPIEVSGRPCILSSLYDITDRRVAEQALRDSEAKFAQAFRASPGAMGISSVETRQFVEVNDGYRRIFGYTREEMIGRTGVELGLWADDADRLKFFDAIAQQGFVRDMEVVGLRRDGTRIHCLLSSELVELDGRPHMVIAASDITARKRAEQERATLETQLRQTQKLDALGQLAGGIAHDFNNILMGIGAYTELALMDAEHPAEVRSHLAQVRRAGDRAADLVRQILTFSRKTPQERKPTRLHVVMREALKLLRSSIPKTITILDRLDPIAPVVLADATQVHQVVMNLCTNAAHAMTGRAGCMTVTLETLAVEAGGVGPRPDLEPGRYARIVVSDTGHGMDDATMARIFEPFFTTKAPGEGTGLGLSVVHGIVKDHDGIVTVRSMPGEGTTFEVCLPEHGEVSVAEVEANTELPRGNGERILFVDDEATISTAVGQLLTIVGYRVSPYSDPRTAWAAFEAAPSDFDLVITDLMMPHLTGAELARRVLAKRPGMPVLLATGQGLPWTPESIRALGVRGVIPKPLTIAKLARAVRDALETGAVSTSSRPRGVA